VLRGEDTAERFLFTGDSQNKGGKILSSPWGSDFASQNKEDL